ncbi:MAG: hypothetical protein NTU66_03755 [Elusimicrobia bacterium]|nr:hypothetical protein [Elusimicrobiota bacterium]
MRPAESKVTKKVREAVVKTAGEIEKMGATVQGAAKTAFMKMRAAAEDAQKNQDRVKTEAKRITAQVKGTVKDAVKGFKEGMKEVRRNKKK